MEYQLAFQTGLQCVAVGDQYTIINYHLASTVGVDWDSLKYISIINQPVQADTGKV